MPDLLNESLLAERIESALAIARAKAGAAGAETPGAASHLDSIRAALPELDFLERIDQGGQGTVYRAVERESNRAVAVKVLHDGPLSSRSQRGRFAREVELIARMQHPNIVRLHRSGTTAHHQYFVMEHIDGIPIDDFVRYSALPVREVVALFEKVCRAVGYAHALSIVHRDLKPGNILVDLDGEPHLLDFGLAKGADTGESPDHRISLTGQVVGTLPYSSPEQAAGKPAQVDARSDVYSLGVILYQLLTGRMPYPIDGSPDELRANIISRPAEQPRVAAAAADPDERGTVGSIPDELACIVLRALAKEKHRRYPSAEAFADDLNRFLSGRAVVARADSRWYLIRKAIARHPLTAALLLTIMILLSGGLVTVTMLWRHAERVGRVAKAGLEMGSFIKLGSVARDSGRADQAIGMFEKAAELGRIVSIDDSDFIASAFTANYQLADLLYDRGDAPRAEPFAACANRIAEDLNRADSANMEWRRLLGFSFMLRAKAATTAKDYNSAIRHFEQATAIRQQLAVQNPDNDALQGNLAQSIANQGMCLRLMGRMDRAILRYQAAYRIYNELARRKPEDIDRLLDVAITENRFASWHISQKTPEGNIEAAKWLSRAEKTLGIASGLKGAGDCSADLGRLRDAISRNLQVLARREARSAGASQPVQAEAPSP